MRKINDLTDRLLGRIMTGANARAHTDPVCVHYINDLGQSCYKCVFADGTRTHDCLERPVE